MWRIPFHGHVTLNLMTTAAILTQIDIYNFVYKYDSKICYIHTYIIHVNIIKVA